MRSPFFFCLLLILFACKNSDSQNSKPNDSGSAKNTAFKDYDTLTLIFAASNYVFYYDNELRIDANGNNFKSISANNSKGIKAILQLFENEAAKKKENLLVLLKIQDVGKLNDASKTSVDLIKTKYFFKEKELTEVEKTVVKITEEAFGVKSQ